MGFQKVRNTLSLRALTNELDRVSINPLVPYCVCVERTHVIPNLGPCAFCPLDTVQPLFYCNWLYLIELGSPHRGGIQFARLYS